MDDDKEREKKKKEEETSHIPFAYDREVLLNLIYQYAQTCSNVSEESQSLENYKMSKINFTNILGPDNPSTLNSKFGYLTSQDKGGKREGMKRLQDLHKRMIKSMGFNDRDTLLWYQSVGGRLRDFGAEGYVLEPKEKIKEGNESENILLNCLSSD